jgi:hypothetical protein
VGSTAGAAAIAPISGSCNALLSSRVHCCRLAHKGRNAISFFRKVSKVFAPAPESHEIGGIDATSFPGAAISNRGRVLSPARLGERARLPCAGRRQLHQDAAVVPSSKNRYDRCGSMAILMVTSGATRQSAMTEARYSGRAFGNFEPRIFRRTSGARQPMGALAAQATCPKHRQSDPLR